MFERLATQQIYVLALVTIANESINNINFHALCLPLVTFLTFGAGLHRLTDMFVMGNL